MNYGRMENIETIIQVWIYFYILNNKINKDALVEIVAKLLSLVPPWTRIYRIQRDIPMPLVTSGVDNGNLRELALVKMKDMNIPCRDIRTREVGIREIH